MCSTRLQGEPTQEGRGAEHAQPDEQHAIGSGTIRSRLGANSRLTTWSNELADSMRPWAAAGGYFNFAERACDIDAILPDATCERLLDVKRKWDPDGRIVANHALSLSAA